jgi:hypothetical protein
MNRFRFGSLLAAGAITVGAIVTATAPMAQAESSLARDQNLCNVIGGTFTTEIFGGQTHSTCTFANGYHHLYYANGEFRSAD